MAESDDQNNLEVYELSAHWHFFAGEALTKPDIGPLCLRLDAETEESLCEGDPVAWRFLITLVESGKSLP